MLIIAVGYGYSTDPFTTSASTRADYCIPEPFSGDDRQACMDFICKEKGLKPEQVDCILVVDNPDYDTEPEVIHNYTEFD